MNTPNVHPFAKAAAQALGWIYEPGPATNDAYARLREPESGATVSLYAPRYPPSAVGRVKVAGVYPTAASGAHVIDLLLGPQITVAMGRGPDAFANDFRRRFLPTFLPLWQEASRRSTESLVRTDQADQLLDQLAAIIGATRIAHKEHTANWYGEGFYGSVNVWESGEVDFKILHLPPEEARQVAAIIGNVLRQRNDRGG